MNQQEIEKVGAAFDRQKLLIAREKSWEGVRAIAAAMKPGMEEEEAYELARSILRGLGSEKDWHRPWVRFGESTVLPYGVPSKPHNKLKENDIFFIDIGPVWDGYEGDAGDVFVVGENPEYQRCQADVRKIFGWVKDRWAFGKVTGVELYNFAREVSEGLRWQFNTRGASGHRLSDFPHAVHFKGNLMERPFTPSECAWMLEIQIRHPEREFGAFYEDLLF